MTTAADWAAKLAAAEARVVELEADNIEVHSRFACLLDSLTYGRMSKTNYSVEVMEEEIDAAYERLYEQDKKDTAQIHADAVATLEAEVARLKSRLDSLHRSKYEYAKAENDRLRLALETATRERDEARARLARIEEVTRDSGIGPAAAANNLARLSRPAPPADAATEAATEAVREAFRVLLSEPGDLDYPVEDVYSEGPDVDGNGDAPFWSEAGLYGRVGKEAARTLLARHRRATEALAALSTPAPAPSAHAMRRCEQPEVEK